MTSNRMMIIKNRKDIPKYLHQLDREKIRSASFSYAKKIIKVYDANAHKGTRGHAGIFAGSHGMMGACILATKACSRSGVGKTTAFAPDDSFDLIHQTVPEALVKSQSSLDHIDITTIDAIGIGPGMGVTAYTGNLIKKLFKKGKPIVIDADAINYLAKHRQLLNKIPPGSILTPHLLEWERLFSPTRNDHERLVQSLAFSQKSNCLILLKGHFSCLVTPKSGIYLNATGNSGMGKAGSGDVLTGLLTGLLAQRYSAEDAGMLAMFLHGLAGDITYKEIGEDAMTASDLLQHLSHAFKLLRI